MELFGWDIDDKQGHYQQNIYPNKQATGAAERINKTGIYE